MTAPKCPKILITGGLGFIGSSLIALLKKVHGESIDIVVLDNFSLGTLNSLADALNCPFPNDCAPNSSVYNIGGVIVRKGDVRVKSDIADAIVGVNVVVHLAAQTSVHGSVEDPVEDFEQNVVGLFNVLNAVRLAPEMPKIVFSSSNAPLGHAEQPVSEQSLPHPISPYGASKLIAETYLCAFNESYGLHSVALRFGNVYGPGSLSNNGLVAKFIRQALNDEILEIYGDGRQTRDFIYIDDLTRAIEKAIFLDNEKFELFHISSGEETEVHALTISICEAFEKAGHRRPQFEFAAERKGDMKRNFSDVSKARNILKWQVEQDLQKGIAKTLDWFLEQGIAKT